MPFWKRGGSGGGPSKEGAPGSGAIEHLQLDRKHDLHGLSSQPEDRVGGPVGMYVTMFDRNPDLLRVELDGRYGKEPEQGSHAADDKPAVWARVLTNWGLNPEEHPLKVLESPKD